MAKWTEGGVAALLPHVPAGAHEVARFLTCTDLQQLTCGFSLEIGTDL
jgi:hypothetical protein